MLTDILNWTALGRFVVLAAAATIGASSPGRRPEPALGVRGQVGRLAAQVALVDPELARELRHVTRRITSLVAALEGELHRFRPLERRFEQVASQVQDGSDDDPDGELFERLAGRFGVLRVRPALQRLNDAHPDAPDDEET